MHWSVKIAQDIIAKYPSRDEYVVASGITPSGSVHIGNFREFVTTYFVGKALQDLGKPVRMIFSWDDFDRFRKVPGNIDASYKQYIGTPVCDVPNPFGNDKGAKSYAEHFEKEFEDALEKLGMNEIPVQFIYQHKEYRNGRYDKAIAHAVVNRHKIYDIITSFKTQDSNAGERESYTPVQKFGDELKLVWKVDWPMRWRAEGVVFEPGGPDHMTDGGSYAVASVIAREIFDYEPPMTLEYGFVGIKGAGVKMSSSKGNVVTPAQLLNIYELDMIKWLFAKYAPKDFFEFGFDDTIVRHYSEYDREHPSNKANFGTLAVVAPLAGFDKALVKKMIGHDGGERLDKVRYWLENYAPEKIYNLCDKFNAEFYQTLSDDEKRTLKKLHGFLGEKTRAEKEIQEFLYSIINDPTKEKKQNIAAQQRYFKIFYNMLFGRDDGPRLYLYLAVAPCEQVRVLLAR